MATETIVRTLTDTTPQPDIAQQLSQPPEEPKGGTRGSGGSFPLDQLNTEETRVRATLINAFWRRLQCQGRGAEGGGPPDDDDLGEGGGDDPFNEEPDGAGLQDHVPIPQA